MRRWDTPDGADTVAVADLWRQTASQRWIGSATPTSVSQRPPVTGRGWHPRHLRRSGAVDDDARCPTVLGEALLALDAGVPAAGEAGEPVQAGRGEGCQELAPRSPGLAQVLIPDVDREAERGRVPTLAFAALPDLDDPLRDP